MPSYRHILFETPEPAIALITLNRPDYLNAYTNPLCEEVVQALHEFMEDDTLRCLVLTGAGRGFCSGGDVSGEGDGPNYRNRQMGHAQEMRAGMHRVVTALHRMDKPVVAMINGAAVAGGLTLALACDFRIAADSAKLGDTSGKFGLLPDEGGRCVASSTRAMGLDRALKMTMLHEIYPAAEALKLGLVTDVVVYRPEQLRALLHLRPGTPRGHRQDARRWRCAWPRSMMRQGAVVTSLENSLERCGALAMMIANPSKDVREGIAAFREKREPKFEGR